MSDKDGVFWQGVGRVVHILKHVRARDGQNCAVVGEAQTEKKTVREHPHSTYGSVGGGGLAKLVPNRTRGRGGQPK